MDLRFVSSLVLVIDAGSLAAAARVEGITPSAVAQRIAALEALLGVPLLVRAGRVMQPTPECRTLLPGLRQLLRDEQALKGLLHGDGLEGPLRLGAISTVIGDHARALVAGLRSAAPQVELQLSPGASSALFAEFEAEKLDAAVIVRPGFPLPKAMQFTPVARQEIGWLLPEAAAVEGSVEALPYILYSRKAWGGAVCWEALVAQHHSPKILAEMDALESIAMLVEDGLGRAVLPRWAALRRYARGAEFVPIPGLYRDIGLLSWSRDRRRPVLKLVLQILQGTGGDQRGR
ncbi:LysR family transcriptional regulator [Pseudophaeobacter arcticus]|uniref:LysR family transcriptional regulator n=1 Tax=Pseudophaeobacter arcticus TaxID=385492 RepID=UPI003A96A975